MRYLLILHLQQQQRLQEELFPIDEGEKTIEKLEGKLLRKKFVLDVVSY